MKRNLLILVIILLIGFIVNSCGDDEESECSICKSGQHCYTHCVNENCNVHDCENHNINECPVCNPICNLGAHLGIDETCNGNNCTLQDHRNAAQKIAFPDNGVGRPIYRYGKLSNYNISDPKEIEKTVDMIIDIFTGEGGLYGRGESIYNRINDNIDKLCVTKTSGDYGYTWGGMGQFSVLILLLMQRC